MARQGTPLSGRNRYLTRTLVEGPDCSLVAYTNTPDSLGNDTTPGDLMQPSQANGYAAIALPAAGWSVANGIATYAQPAGPNFDSDGNPAWFATGAWSADVTGVALVQSGVVLHFFDHRDGNGSPLAFVSATGRKLVVDLSALTA